jgi:hypothetical protein
LHVLLGHKQGLLLLLPLLVLQVLLLVVLDVLVRLLL